MSDSVFFDTNVLIYLVAEDDPRTAAAERIVAEGGVVSVQVLNEFVSVARRKLAMSWKDVADALGAIRALCSSCVPLTIETHEAALQLAEKHGYHVYDALVVAAALQAGCRTLYSEDLQAGQVFNGRLTIVNPFS